MQVKMTQRLNQGLIAAEDAVIAIRALPVAAAEEPRKEAVVKLLRQTVLDVGGTATQMRMALERGAVVADKVSALRQAMRDCQWSRSRSSRS